MSNENLQLRDCRENKTHTQKSKQDETIELDSKTGSDDLISNGSIHILPSMSLQGMEEADNEEVEVKIDSGEHDDISNKTEINNPNSYPYCLRVQH